MASNSLFECHQFLRVNLCHNTVSGCIRRSKMIPEMFRGKVREVPSSGNYEKVCINRKLDKCSF